MGTPPGPAWFTDAMLHDEGVAALAGRVTVVTDPEVEARRAVDPSHLGATVTLRLTDGRRFQESRAIGHGHPSEPMSDLELSTKFGVLAAPLLGSRAAAELATSIMTSALDAPASPLLDVISGNRSA
jgi:2-methylcitrate dehydratase PrpD